MEMLDVSAQTVTRLIEDGSLKAYKVRNKLTSPWRINYDSVIAYVDEMHNRAGLDRRF
jgi:excisionase family DNA binding protein